MASGLHTVFTWGEALSVPTPPTATFGQFPGAATDEEIAGTYKKRSLSTFSRQFAKLTDKNSPNLHVSSVILGCHQ